MSSAMDLDRSLDDIIKKRKDKNQRKQPKSQQKSKQQGNRAGNGGGRSRQGGRSFSSNYNNNIGGGGRRGVNKNSLSISSKSKTINKSTKGNKNVASRRGGGGGQSQQQQQQQQQQRPKNTTALSSSSSIDPSKIVITKKVSRNNSNGSNNYINNNNNHNNNGNRNNHNINNGRMNPFIPTGPAAEARGPHVTQRGFSIRGASYGAASHPMFGGNGGSGGFSIRGESGPATVLISNLDPGANADDIRMICAQFGQVSHCEVAVDQTGRSFGEAQVEFVQKQSALDCINKLDNEIADGRIVRAILRSRPSGMMGGYMNQTVRSVIAPSRSGFTSA